MNCNIFLSNYFLCSIAGIFSLEYVRRYASAEAMNENEDNMSTSSESSLSDFSEDEAQDMEL